MTGSDIRIVNTPLESRVETGPLQFNDDWPGTFIRGDNAGWYAMLLGQLLDNPAVDNPLLIAQLRGLQSDLASSNINPEVKSMISPSPESLAGDAGKETKGGEN